MTLLTCIMIGVIFAASIYLMLGSELKGVCMGVFLLSHGANLTIIAASRSPIGRFPPVLGQGYAPETLVDPLPQALVLTAIVIGFAVQAFLLTLLVVTWRGTKTLEIDRLGEMGQ
jgi:multicomponent Na+:H+ antiporter subunit C